MRPARRAFFMPRFLVDSPWAKFCQRLSRAVVGRLDADGAQAGLGRATLSVIRDEDVYHARALCAEYGVLLVLPGALPECLPADRHQLVLTLAEFTEVDLFDIRQGTVALQSGCTNGQLRDLVLGSDWQWPYGEDAQTVAAWIAGSGGWPSGRCSQSGLVWADVMLADGEFERLGPFGVEATRPLRSSASSRLISSLFELAGSEDVQTMLSMPVWPGNYRLDALTPALGYDALMPPNPVHLLLGSAGSLAWVGKLQLQLLPAHRQAPVEVVRTRTAGQAAVRFEHELVDDRIKGLFDTAGIFPRSVV